MLHLIDVRSRFHDEHIAFSTASRFLNAADIAALQGSQPIAEVHTELAACIKESHGTPRQYFLARLFIGHISAFELYLQQSVMAVAARHPHKVGAVEFKLADVLDTPDTEELVQRAAEEVLNKLMYKRPSEYLEGLSKLLSFPVEIVTGLWPIFVEAKARRDLGVHNGWACNDTYLRKLKEIGAVGAPQVGDNLMPTEGEYIEKVADALYALANRIYDSSRV